MIEAIAATRTALAVLSSIRQVLGTSVPAELEPGHGRDRQVVAVNRELPAPPMVHVRAWLMVTVALCIRMVCKGEGAWRDVPVSRSADHVRMSCCSRGQVSG